VDLHLHRVHFLVYIVFMLTYLDSNFNNTDNANVEEIGRKLGPDTECKSKTNRL